MSRRNQVGIRLVALDGKTVERELKKFGAEGQAALGRIQKASKPARAGLRAVDASVGDLKTRMSGLASSAGPVGTALMALGPAGTTAAVGIGALALAFTKALSVSRDAVREFDALSKRARTLGLSSDLFQSLQLAADEQGIAQASLNVALQTFVTRAGEAANATGTLYSRLKQTNPALLEQFQAASSGEERLRLLAAAVRELDSAEERAALTAAAFGQRNVDMVRILADTSESFDDLIARAKSLGVVVEERVLENAEEMENRFGIAARVIDLNLKQAFVDLAPLLISTLEWFGKLAQSARELSDAFRDIEDRSSATIAGSIDALQAGYDQARFYLEDLRAKQAGAVNDLARATFDDAIRAAEAELATWGEKLKRSRAELEQRDETKPGSGGGGSDPLDPAAVKRAEAIRKSILTIEEKRAAALAAIVALEEKGLLTSEQASLARIKAERDFQALAKKATSTSRDRESEAMLREVTRLIEAARTPAEDLAARLERIAELEKSGTFDKAAPGRGTEAAEQARVIAMRDYLSAAEDTEAALRTIEEIAQNGAGANQLAAKITLAERAGKGFAETMQEAGEGIADSLTDAIFEAKTLGDALQQLARQIARDFVNSQFRSMLTGGGGGGIFGALGSLVGGLFGGGGSGGGGAPLNLMASVRHDGGTVGGPGATRAVPAAIFAGAPRFHGGGGLGPGERAVIGLQDEYVMTRAMQGNLVETLRALGAMGAARAPAATTAPVINIVTPPGTTAETRESRTGGGAPQIDVLIKPLERALATSVREGGPLQGAIGKTFGLSRAKGLA